MESGKNDHNGKQDRPRRPMRQGVYRKRQDDRDQNRGPSDAETRYRVVINDGSYLRK